MTGASFRLPGGLLTSFINLSYDIEEFPLIGEKFIVEFNQTLTTDKH